MKNLSRSFAAGLLVCFLFSSVLFAGRQHEETHQYGGIEKVKIKLVLGNCLINKSKDKTVHIKVVHTYDEDDFEARFNEKGKTLHIKEKLYGHNNGGYSDWTISVPDGIEIDFETATGSLEISGVKDVEIDGNSGTGSLEVMDAEGSFKLNTGTGSIEVADTKGELDLNSGTGRVKVYDCTGGFDVNSGTGGVYAKNITIENDADFNSGTGDAEVTKPLGDDFDLSLNSGTGDAVLDMDGQPIKGYYEFTVNSRRGRIDSPVEFDDVEEYDDGNEEYVRKSFTKGGKTPRYYISSGTGTAELKR